MHPAFPNTIIRQPYDVLQRLNPQRAMVDGPSDDSFIANDDQWPSRTCRENPNGATMMSARTPSGEFALKRSWDAGRGASGSRLWPLRPLCGRRWGEPGEDAESGSQVHLSWESPCPDMFRPSFYWIFDPQENSGRIVLWLERFYVSLGIRGREHQERRGRESGSLDDLISSVFPSGIFAQTLSWRVSIDKLQRRGYHL